MKNFLLFIFFIPFTSFAQFKNEADKIEFNRVYNNYVYIYKNTYNHLKDNDIKKMDIYAGGKIVKTFVYDKQVRHVDYYFKRFFYFTVNDSIEREITKVRMVNSDNSITTISVANNNMKFANDSKLEKYCIDQVNFMLSYGHATHDQNGMDMGERIDKAGLDFWGDFTEICSKDFNTIFPKNNFQKTTQILENYYFFRNKTEHWSAVVDPISKKCSTYYFQDGNGRMYAISVLLEGDLLLAHK